MSKREMPRKKPKPVRVAGRVYESMTAAAAALGVSPGAIHSALNKNHRCRGLEVSDV